MSGQDDLLAGTMFQRGPQGQVPAGGSGEIPLNGPFEREHVTMYGQGWHRSWDNNQGGVPGTTGDHSTYHVPGQPKQDHPDWRP